VCFAEAVYTGRVKVGRVRAERVTDVSGARTALRRNTFIPVLVDPRGCALGALRPTVVIDARMQKGRSDTSRSDAPLVVGLGPGFTAGCEVHLVIETNRGPGLGRIINRGMAQPDTGIPAPLVGHTSDRVVRAPATGVFRARRCIGDLVRRGGILGWVASTPVKAPLGGLLRGLVHENLPVTTGMKLGDIDPRGRTIDPGEISDKARAVAGGVLEAVITSIQTMHPPHRHRR
jgi:xanthine dehydrogenase accessory factor